MTKLVSVFLSALMVLSLAGCSGKPSDEKIKAALQDGTITVEDAKAKGWIDDAWMESHFEQVEAKTKIYLFDEFNTTYLDGTPASSKLIAGQMCLVFFNTESKTGLEKLDAYKQISAEMDEMGVPVLGIITDKDPTAAKEALKDLPFPVLVYNEEMHASLKEYSDLLSSDIVSVFTKEGGFYSAWSNNASADDILTMARSFADEK